VPGLPDERADIIVAGVLLVDVLIRRLGVNEARVHDGGIRDGLMLSMVREHFGRASGGTGGAAGLDKGGNARAAGGPTQDVMTARAGSPLRGVRRFAESCNYEASHAGHVAGLALQIFDAVGPWAGGRRVHRAQEGESPRLPAFTARDRTLLEAAALLHDVGYLVNYASHHKHSYHLIVHADLPGFTHREIQVIANVARYHRAAAPKPRHRAFAVLSADDRTLVRALSALLRIADGLDRTHMQRVTGVLVTLGRKQARFVVSAGEEPSVDLWGAIRKSDLFGAVFGRAPEFEWAAGRSAAPPNVRVSGGVEAALMPRNGD
jgi:exopolyphosphatase/guanosine-5'-triphosphate,3'-diphosphate pyrophosphatase